MAENLNQFLFDMIEGRVDPDMRRAKEVQKGASMAVSSLKKTAPQRMATALWQTFAQPQRPPQEARSAVVDPLSGVTIAPPPQAPQAPLLERFGKGTRGLYDEIRRPKLTYRREPNPPLLKTAAEFYSPYVKQFKKGFTGKEIGEKVPAKVTKTAIPPATVPAEVLDPEIDPSDEAFTQIQRPRDPILESYGMKQKALEAGHAARKTQISQIRDLREMQMQRGQENYQNIQRMVNDYDAVVKQDMVNARRYMDEATAIKPRGTMRQWVSDQSTFQKIMFSINIAANGGQLSPVLNKIIDSDLDAQEARYNAAQGRYKTQMDFIGKASQMFDNRVQRREMATAAYKGMVSNYMDQIIANTSPGLLQEQYLDKKATINMEMNAHLQKAQLARQSDFYTTIANYMMGGRKDVLGQFDLQDFGEIVANIKDPEARKEFQKRRNDWVPYVGGFASNPKNAEKATVSLPEYDAVISDLERLLEMRDMAGPGGFEVLPGDLKTEANTLAVGLWMKLKNIQKLGVLAGPDLDLLMAQVPDKPLGLGWIEKKLETTLKSTKKDKQLNLKAWGLPSKPVLAGGRATAKRVR